MADEKQPAMNRRAFFRRGVREMLKPLAEMAEQINHPVARLPDRPVVRPRPADGRVARGEVMPEEGVTIDPYPPEANPESPQRP